MAGFVTTPRGATTPRRVSLSGAPLRVPSLDLSRASPTAQDQVSRRNQAAFVTLYNRAYHRTDALVKFSRLQLVDARSVLTRSSAFRAAGSTRQEEVVVHFEPESCLALVSGPQLRFKHSNITSRAGATVRLSSQVYAGGQGVGCRLSLSPAQLRLTAMTCIKFQRKWCRNSCDVVRLGG